MSVSISFNDIAALISQVKPLAAPTINARPASNEDIGEFERQYGIKVPHELREWLLYCNGADINPGGLYGLKCSGRTISIEACLDREPRWIDKEWFPIANDGCGDYYILAAREMIPGNLTHPIFFVDQSDYQQPRYVVASNLRCFLWFLITDELALQQGRESFWPFDEQRVLAIDPALARVKNLPLPWNADKI